MAEIDRRQALEGYGIHLEDPAEAEFTTADTVHKYGGSSVQQMGKVTEIIASEVSNGGSHVIVVSAMKGVTDSLIAAWDQAPEMSRLETFQAVEDLILYPHLAKAEELGFGGPELTHLSKVFGEPSMRLADDLYNGHISFKDSALSAGERFSSLLVTTQLNRIGIRAVSVDATDIVHTYSGLEERPRINWDTTSQDSQDVLGFLIRKGLVPVVTGFIASDEDGRTVTLGRDASNYTASILGKTMRAKTVNIWTDVNGLYTGNPNTDPRAKFIPEMSHDNAAELAGAKHKILFPNMIEPLRGSDTVLVIRNTFNPRNPGTRIVPRLTR